MPGLVPDAVFGTALVDRCVDARRDRVTLRSMTGEDYTLPYIGINVDRLPELVADALTRDRWERTDLYARWADRYGTTTKTAKEYVSSLANLNILEREGLQTVRVPHLPPDDRQLLRSFNETNDWQGFFAFMCRRSPGIELLRSVYLRDHHLREPTTRAESVNALRRALARAGVLGIERPKSLEAFLRLLERAAKQTTRSRRSGSIDPNRLAPRLRAALDTLDAHDRAILDELLEACRHLARGSALYEQTGVFSIGDVLRELGQSSPQRLWLSGLFRLRDRSLLSLHQTIPSAAASLGLVTVQDGAGVASAISFPRRLWLASDHGES